MKRVVLLSVVVIVFCSTAISIKAESIRDYCKSIVGESYTLMESCINQEQEAKSWIRRHSVDSKIKSYCENIVGESHNLIRSCIKQEQEAKEWLRRRSVDPGIKSHCKNIVGESYNLMKSCVKQEEGAKIRLGY